MPLDRFAFALAVSEHLASNVAVRLEECWAAFAPTPEPDESDADAGRALAVAMSALPPIEALQQLGALSLFGVDIRQGAESFFLPPADAFRHPLLGDWTPTTFTDALGEAICSGRIGMSLCTTFPMFDRFEMIAEEGVIRQAVAYLICETRLGNVSVALRYGGPPNGRFGVVTHANGDAVFAVGLAMRPGPAPTIIDGGPGEPTASPSQGLVH